MMIQQRDEALGSSSSAAGWRAHVGGVFLNQTTRWGSVFLKRDTNSLQRQAQPIYPAVLDQAFNHHQFFGRMEAQNASGRLMYPKPQKSGGYMRGNLLFWYLSFLLTNNKLLGFFKVRRLHQTQVSGPSRKHQKPYEQGPPGPFLVSGHGIPAPRSHYPDKPANIPPCSKK